MIAAKVRSLYRVVYEEREKNSKPLCDHVCASCGHLLSPPWCTRTQDRDLGRSGPPYPARGKSCAFNDMPPVLLLFSNAFVVRRLPTIFSFETGKLFLRKGMRAPWLHFHAGHVYDTRPWWYCLPCYRYLVPIARQHTFISNQSVPMRNRLEGYRTLWHRDIAYPILYPGLRRFVSGLSNIANTRCCFRVAASQGRLARCLAEPLRTLFRRFRLKVLCKRNRRLA